MDKIFLRFRKPWWNAEWGGVNFLYRSTGAQRPWHEHIFGFFTVRGQPNLLEGWISGPAARQLETVPEEELLRQCSALLRGSVGSRLPFEEPIGLIRTRWYSNPNFRGSYSYRAIKSREMDVWARDLAAPVVDVNGKTRLLFAGEATHDHCYSNVHAAVETGWREADRILELSRSLTSKL